MTVKEAKHANNLTNEEELKREKRRASNRRSAHKSRYREMVMMDEYQRRAELLSKENDALKRENEIIRQIMTLLNTSQNIAPTAPQMVRAHPRFRV